MAGRGSDSSESDGSCAEASPQCNSSHSTANCTRQRGIEVRAAGTKVCTWADVKVEELSVVARTEFEEWEGTWSIKEFSRVNSHKNARPTLARRLEMVVEHRPWDARRAPHQRGMTDKWLGCTWRRANRSADATDPLATAIGWARRSLPRAAGEAVTHAGSPTF